MDHINLTQVIDDFFIKHFSQLNETGQALFKEALEEEYSKQNNSSDDEMCKFCRIMATEQNSNIKSITPDMLSDKFRGNRILFL